MARWITVHQEPEEGQNIKDPQEGDLEDRGNSVSIAPGKLTAKQNEWPSYSEILEGHSDIPNTGLPWCWVDELAEKVSSTWFGWQLNWCLEGSLELMSAGDITMYE